MTFRRMVALSFAAVLFFVMSPAHADWDWRAGFGGRSLPLGAAGMAELGYGHLLWGEPGEGTFLYGYIRPLLRYQGLGLANRGDLALEVNPISFLNIRGGLRSRYRFLGSFSTLDCDSAICRGLLTSPFISGKMVLGARGVFFGFTWSWEKISLTDTSRRFAEEFSALYGAPGGDTLLGTEILLGSDIADGWSAGVLWQQLRMRSSGTSNDLKGLFARKKWDQWSGIFGCGAYESSTQSPAGPVIFFQAEFRGTPTLAIF
jgi:hypothetical protein